MCSSLGVGSTTNATAWSLNRCVWQAIHVNTNDAASAPPGWYPDPSGARQWRVWTGALWSEVTRPYGDQVSTPKVTPRPSIVGNLSLIQALHRLVRVGIAADFAGIAVIVSVYAHWPGTAHPTPYWFAMSAVDVGIALVLLGTALFAVAAKELVGRWTPWAFVPGVNLMVVNGIVTQRLGGKPGRRVASEAVLMALFISQFHAEPWTAIAPVVVAVGQSQWTATLIENLLNSPTSSQPATP